MRSFFHSVDVSFDVVRTVGVDAVPARVRAVVRAVQSYCLVLYVVSLAGVSLGGPVFFLKAGYSLPVAFRTTTTLGGVGYLLLFAVLFRDGLPSS